jgi:hypothetical protein
VKVIVGPTTEDGPNYFSLNNRRLWVLKRCREEGLLEENRVFVRVRQPKSTAEAGRYSIDNCALEAKIIPFKEKERDDNNDDARAKGDSDTDATTSTSKSPKGEIQIEQGGGDSHVDKKAIRNEGVDSDDESSESDHDDVPSTNRFSALF